MTTTSSVKNMGPVGNLAGRDNNIGQQNNFYGGAHPDPPKSLPEAQGASFNSKARDGDRCLDKTRVDLLEKIYNWADDKNKPCIFWLNGLAGEGKSTVARTVCHRWSKHKRLAASFFFPETGGGIGYADHFVTTIAAQLKRNVPVFKNHISEVLSDEPNIDEQILQEQWQRFILDPFSKLEENNCHRPYLLVVDALDQCNDNDTLRTLLDLFSELASLQTTQLRVFVTSRPEHLIAEWFNQRPDTPHQQFSLHLDILRSDVDRDIELFLTRYITAPAVQGDDIKQLVDRAAGLFKWAQIAALFIGNDPFAEERLAILLNSSSNNSLLQQITRGLPLNASNVLFQIMISCGFVRQGLAVKEWLNIRPHKDTANHLDWIYLTVLVNSLPPDLNAQHIRRLSARIRDVLGSVVVLYSPLSIQSLSKLLPNYQKGHIKETLDRFRSVLEISRDEDPVVSLPHPSFREFLVDGTRCYDWSFWVDEKQAHLKLADECIRLMLPLKEDICGLVLPGSLAADMENDTVKQHLPQHVQYACLYWTQHLQKGSIQLRDGGQVHEFLNAHFLHWLEALGWMRRIPDAIRSILILKDMAHKGTSPCLHSLIVDMKQFTIYNRNLIELAPLQVYSSALIFTPATSPMRKQFEKKLPSWIQKTQKIPEVSSNLPLATLEAHVASVYAIVFSQDGKRLASASIDGTIHLWDTESTLVAATFRNHDRDPNSHAFAYSSNSKRLASTSNNGIIRLWNEESEQLVAMLKGHKATVNDLTFSQDGKLLASAASDGTVRLWDSSLGKHLYTFNGDYDGQHYYKVIFSHDGERLAAGASDGSLWLWDSERTLVKGWRPSESSVTGLAFSRDGQRLASASNRGGGIMLWDGRSGTEVAILRYHNHHQYVAAITFSEDGKRLASASDYYVRLWNCESGAKIATLKGEASGVAFSRDGKQLASSSSYNDTVMLWDGKSGAALMMFKGHTSDVNAIAFSPDGQWLASGSEDTTIKLWDRKLRVEVETTECHSDFVSAVEFSRDGKQLASSSFDETVKLWDSESGKALGSFKGHTRGINDVAFSPDGQWLASGSDDETVKLWDSKLRTTLGTFKGHGDAVLSVAFSPDGKWLASISFSEVILWDIEKRERLGRYSIITEEGKAVAFSIDGKQLVMQVGERISIGDINTFNGTIELGEMREVIQLPWKAKLKRLSYSSDGLYLDTNMGIYRVKSGKQTTPEEFDLTISPEREWIMLGSQRLLWLPAEYRVVCAAVKDQTIFLGHDSGELSYFRFDFAKLPPGMAPQQ